MDKGWGAIRAQLRLLNPIAGWLLSALQVGSTMRSPSHREWSHFCLSQWGSGQSVPQREAETKAGERFSQLLLTAHPWWQDVAFCLLHMLSSQVARVKKIQGWSVWIQFWPQETQPPFASQSILTWVRPLGHSTEHWHKTAHKHLPAYSVLCFNQVEDFLSCRRLSFIIQSMLVLFSKATDWTTCPHLQYFSLRHQNTPERED